MSLEVVTPRSYMRLSMSERVDIFQFVKEKEISWVNLMEVYRRDGKPVGALYALTDDQGVVLKRNGRIRAKMIGETP